MVNNNIREQFTINTQHYIKNKERQNFKELPEQINGIYRRISASHDALISHFQPITVPKIMGKYYLQV